MFACEVCWRKYLSQREADLCSPREEWPDRYPDTVAQEITAGNSAFQEKDQNND